MKKNLLFFAFYLLINSVIYSVEIERIRPSEEITVFDRESVDFMFKATDDIGLAYAQWTLNGKKYAKHIVTGKFSTDNLSIIFPNVGKYYITANVTNLLGKSKMIIWKVNVEEINILAKDDMSNISENVQKNDNKNIEYYSTSEDMDDKSTYFGISKASHFTLPSFIIGLSSSYFITELKNFDKSYNHSGVIQFGTDFLIKIFSLNQRDGIYFGLGYNYLNKNGKVIDANLDQTDTKSSWTNHKLNLSAEYRFELSESFTMFSSIGSSYYLISEEKNYSPVKTIKENNLGFMANIGLSYNILNPISLVIKAQYDYIPVKLKDYGDENLGGTAGIFGLEINF